MKPQRQRPPRRRPRLLAAPLLLLLAALGTLSAATDAAMPSSGPALLPDKEAYRVTELPGVPIEEWGLAPMYAGYMPVETPAAAAAKGSNGASVRRSAQHQERFGFDRLTPHAHIRTQGRPRPTAAA